VNTFLTFLLSILAFTTSSPINPPVVTLGLVGDLSLGRYVTSIARNKNNFNWIFQEISPWLQQNNFNLANLESPIITDCPRGETGTFTFCGDQRFLPYLKENKFVFNLNNNHILNYSQPGLTQTKQFLSTDYFYNEFYFKEINNIKFGFLGYDFVTYPKLDKTKIINQIKSIDSQVDWLIISVHWGNEYLPQAEKWRIDLAHLMVDNGADIIHGHHPHVWQPSELYKEKLIYYSFGNFVFDQNWSPETSRSKIIRLTLSKDKILNEEVFPIEIKFNSQPVVTP